MEALGRWVFMRSTGAKIDSCNAEAGAIALPRRALFAIRPAYFTLISSLYRFDRLEGAPLNSGQRIDTTAESLPR